MKLVCINSCLLYLQDKCKVINWGLCSVCNPAQGKLLHAHAPQAEHWHWSPAGPCSCPSLCIPRTSLFWPGPCWLQSPPTAMSLTLHCLSRTWNSLFPRVTLVDLHPEAAKRGQTLGATRLPHRVPFSSGSWDQISVPRKALLSTTAKHSILQNNFQLYSLEYRHLPHQLHQGSSAQPALTASGALVPSATPAALAASGTEALVLLSSSRMGFKTFDFSYKQTCTEKTLPWGM